MTASCFLDTNILVYSVDEKDKMYRCEYGDAVRVNADFKAEEPWVCVVNTCYHSAPYCPYLHQLQHALLSCGIVKELKPDMPGDCPLAGSVLSIQRIRRTD